MEGSVENVNSDKTIFFADREVIVIKIIFQFNLAKVRYLNCKQTFYVDINSLSEKADLTNTISIHILGEV